jgi:hypothetical protein
MVANSETIVQFRALSGQDQHSNVSADVGDEAAADALLTDPENGDLTLATNSPLKNAGVVVPGITTTFNGVAPDIGYWEAP